MRALLPDLNLAAAATLAQRVGHQPDERDVLAAGFADAIVGRVQALQSGLLFGLGELRQEPRQRASLFEREVVVVHAEKVHQSPASSYPAMGGKGNMPDGETGKGFMSQRAKVL